jgi:hypothetical protein
MGESLAASRRRFDIAQPVLTRNKRDSPSIRAALPRLQAPPPQE